MSLFFPSHLYKCIIPTLQILNSMKDNKSQIVKNLKNNMSITPIAQSVNSKKFPFLN